MRSRGILTLLLAFSASLAIAADSPVKWEVTRTAPPADLEEAKALQATVKAMVEKVTPSTVAVFYQAGAGSGVIISEDGLVLTAAHVVSRSILDGPGGNGNRRAADPRKVSLQLPDGTTVKGTILGRNSLMDSAMVKITDPVPKNAKWPGADKGKWPAVELGKSKDTKKGLWVVSLGHPGGPKEGRRPPVRLGQIVSSGSEGNSRSERIKSDCTLVGGDSGGPLFDLNGKLLGIHSSIGMDLSQNFHIPTHAFQNEWVRLLRGDSIGARSVGWIGMTLAGDEEKKDRGTSKPVIEFVKPGSPAENAGLKKDDLILEFKGEKVKWSQDIDEMMQGSRVGETVLVKVRRGQETYELEVSLAKRPS